MVRAFLGALQGTSIPPPETRRKNTKGEDKYKTLLNNALLFTKNPKSATTDNTEKPPSAASEKER